MRPDSHAQASGRAVAPPVAEIERCLGSAPGRADAACFDRIAAQGYRQRITYQPADRFWMLQWVETAIFLGLSALLAAVCAWWVRAHLA